MADLWIASPHTLAKLRILERYLQAYLPIMCRHIGRLIYIDGFAGPGRYKRGEDGSPILVLKTILDHNRLPSGCQINLHFIERNPGTYKLLLRHLRELADARAIPDLVTYTLTCGRFADVAMNILSRLRVDGKDVPRFVFIDPFGFGGTPMHVIAELARARSSEALIFFPYASLHRFARVPAKWPTVDGLYGVPTWKQYLAPHDPDLQEQQLVGFYREQLEKQAAFKHIWHFKLIDRRRGRHFYLWFGTNSRKGLSEMKIAGWKVAPDTGQTYVAPLFNGQMELFQPGPPIEELERLLQQEFRGKDPVPIGQVERYVLLETPFSEVLHLREPVLMPMELATPPRIEVSGRNRKAPGDYPPGTMIRFL